MKKFKDFTHEDYYNFSCPFAKIIISNKKHTLYLGKTYFVRYFDEGLLYVDCIIGELIGFCLFDNVRKVVFSFGDEERFVTLYDICCIEEIKNNSQARRLMKGVND